MSQALRPIHEDARAAPLFGNPFKLGRAAIDEADDEAANEFKMANSTVCYHPPCRMHSGMYSFAPSTFSRPPSDVTEAGLRQLCEARRSPLYPAQLIGQCALLCIQSSLFIPSRTRTKNPSRRSVSPAPLSQPGPHPQNTPQPQHIASGPQQLLQPHQRLSNMPLGPKAPVADPNQRIKAECARLLRNPGKNDPAILDQLRSLQGDINARYGLWNPWFIPLAHMLAVSRAVVRDVAEDARRLKKQQTVDELLLFMAAL